MEDLTDVYNDLIMEHSMNSYNKKKLENADYSEIGHNPNCGDEITLELKLNGDKIEDMAFSGHGCAISQASTSIMIDTLRGKTIEEAKEIIKTFIEPPIDNNNYLLIDEQSKEAALVDCSAVDSKINDALSEAGAELKYILLTHGHFDHIGAVDDLVNKYQCSVYLHERDYNCFYDDDINLSNYSKPLNMQAKITLVKDFIECAGFKIQFLNLPGHTHGSCFVIFQDHHIIFSGDVIFKGAVGRYDFPNSSLEETIASIEKIKGISGNYLIYPGHGPSTTLDDEKRNNPYLNRV